MQKHKNIIGFMVCQWKDKLREVNIPDHKITTFCQVITARILDKINKGENFIALDSGKAGYKCDTKIAAEVARIENKDFPKSFHTYVDLRTQEIFYRELMEIVFTVVDYPIFTKGNVKINEIKVGDVHYEYEYGVGIKSVVKTLPQWDSERGIWFWESECCETGNTIPYAQNPDYSHYGINLYDYPAYVSVNEVENLPVPRPKNN